MARFKFSKVHQYNGESIDVFCNCILKVARQCEFSNINERLIDAIIFGTNCTKAQDKLLQTPKTLSLQKCLSVVRHYKSLKLHIQQIGPDKSIEYLRWCNSGKKKGSGQKQSNNFNQNQNQRGCLQSQSRKGTWNQSHNQTGGQSLSNSSKYLPGNKCISCGRNRHTDRLHECPAQGKSCNKCSRLHHFESVCGVIPSRRSQSRPGKAVNELNQNNCDSLTSFPRNSEHDGPMNTVPKQVLDVVNLANKGNSSGKNLQHHLELDTLSTSTCSTTQSQSTQIFSNRD